MFVILIKLLLPNNPLFFCFSILKFHLVFMMMPRETSKILLRFILIFCKLNNVKKNDCIAQESNQSQRLSGQILTLTFQVHELYP